MIRLHNICGVCAPQIHTHLRLMWLSIPMALLACGGPHTPHVNPTAQANFLAAQNLKNAPASIAQQSPTVVPHPVVHVADNSSTPTRPELRIPTETKAPELGSEALSVRLVNGKKGFLTSEGVKLQGTNGNGTHSLVKMELSDANSSALERAVVYSSCREVGISEDRTSDLCVTPVPKDLKNVSSIAEIGSVAWKGVWIRFRIGESEEVKPVASEVYFTKDSSSPLAKKANEEIERLEVRRDGKRVGLFTLGNGDVHADTLYPEQGSEILRGTVEGKTVLIVKMAAPEGEAWIIALPSPSSPSA